MGDNISTVESIQYCGGIVSVLLGITAVHVGDSFSTMGDTTVHVGDSISGVGDTFSTVEIVQYSGGQLQYSGDNISTVGYSFSTMGR